MANGPHVRTVRPQGDTLATLTLTVMSAKVDFGSDQRLDTLEIGDGGKVVFAGARMVIINHLIFNDLDLVELTLAPEPTTLALMALGGLVALRCHR